uniref:Uncharacterized protein n=1 Tax=Cyprinus carpio TaxID=7962 RepID=A0A8C1U6E1_CYPCA
MLFILYSFFSFFFSFISKKKSNKNAYPASDNHLHQIPHQFREIMKSKERMKQSSQKMKKDEILFGEVTMAPPSLSVKPKKAIVKPQVTCLRCYVSQQTFYGEEERVVQLYRQMKQKQRDKHEQDRAAMNSTRCSALCII